MEAHKPEVIFFLLRDNAYSTRLHVPYTCDELTVLQCQTTEPDYL